MKFMYLFSGAIYKVWELIKHVRFTVQKYILQKLVNKRTSLYFVSEGPNKLTTTLKMVKDHRDISIHIEIACVRTNTGICNGLTKFSWC